LRDGCGAGRWPLHPMPRSYDTLERYVRRLAECYGVRYETFCFRALGIALDDSRSRGFTDPTTDVLQRLSVGTGVAVAQFEQMTLWKVWTRIAEELDRIIATPEGLAEFSRSVGRHLSQNSKVLQHNGGLCGNSHLPCRKNLVRKPSVLIHFCDII
jgi:hypothetical protein